MLAGASEAVEPLGDLIASCGEDQVSASHSHMPYRDVKRTLAGVEEPERVVVFLKSEFFRRPLPGAAVEELLHILKADRRPGERRELAFTPLRGAYDRMPPDATAYVHRGERFLLEHTVTLAGRASEGERVSALGWATTSWEAARPWGSGRVYPNFPDPDLDGWAEAYHGGNHGRLQAVKAAYDPENVFRFPQAVAL
jgi:hypothetical protein